MNSTELGALDVLLIDDEPMMRELTEHLLRRLGVREIRVAANGWDALERLADGARAPDVILCDLEMPEMDGIELTRWLGERNVGSAIGFLSGQDPRIIDSAELLARGYGLRVLGSVLKPASIDTLRHLLDAVARSRAIAQRPPLLPIEERELAEGLPAGRLGLHYQPKVSTGERRLVGVEALAKWSHPARGLLSAAAFIPVAEQHGHMAAVTTEVLRQAIRQCAAWRTQGWNLPVAVNVDVDSLTSPDFPERVLELLTAAKVAPKLLTLEVTESRLEADSRRVLEVLARLRLKGIDLSLDDFGTGYASLERLRNIPCSELKIDRAFVNGAARDATARAILESGVSLGRKLGLHLVAEGVETSEDWDLVTTVGCDAVQGYYLARPMPPEDLPGWLGRYQDSHGASPPERSEK